MLNRGEATQWPMLLDMTRDECRKVLRRLELEAYSSVVTVLRAQGSFTTEKQRVLQDLAAMLSISTERHRAEIRLAVNSEKLATIAEHMEGPNTGLDWAREGRRIVPLMPRLVPQTAFLPRANLAATKVATKNAQLPQPCKTAKKIETKKEIDLNHTITSSSISQLCSNNQSIPLPIPSTSNTSTVSVIPPSSSFVVPVIPPSPSISNTPSVFAIPSTSIVPSTSTFVAPAIPPSPSTSTSNTPVFAIPSTSTVSPSSTFVAPAIPPSPSTSTSNTPIFAIPSTSTIPPSSTFIAPAIPPSPSTSTVSPSSTFVAPAIPPSPSTSTSNTPVFAIPSTSTVPPSSTFIAPAIPPSPPLSTPSVIIISSSPTTPNVQSLTFVASTIPSSPSSSTISSSPSSTSNSPSIIVVPSSPLTSIVTSSSTFVTPATPPNPSLSKSNPPAVAVPLSSSTLILNSSVSSSSVTSIIPSSITAVSSSTSSSTFKTPSTLTLPVIPPSYSISTDPTSTFIIPAIPATAPIVLSQPFVPPCPSTSSVSSITASISVSSSSLSPCSSTTIDCPLISVVSTLSDPPSLPLLSMSTISSSSQIPVNNIPSSAPNKCISTSTYLNSLTTSSFLSSIPLISVPPSTSLPSPVTVTSAAVSKTSIIEVVDLEEPVTTTILRPLATSSMKKIEEKPEKIEENKIKIEDVIPVAAQATPPPTLVLPSGMSIQLRDSETDKPKKRKRSLSQDATLPLHKKIITVPTTKATISTPPLISSRTMTFQTPVKISVNTPALSRTSTVPQPPSTQKVIIVSNTNTANSPSILQRSLSIVKSNHNRFQSSQISGNSISSTTSKLRPKMVTVPAKCRPKSNSIVIPMSSSIQNIQLKSLKEDNNSTVDSTVKCLAIPNVPGTTRILPKPSSMLIVNPTSSTHKVPLTSGGTRLLNSHTGNSLAEGMTIQSTRSKPNVVIVHKGSVSKGLKITNASKELMNKMLTGKSIPVNHKRPVANMHHMNNPMPIATTAGNLILLDLSQDQYSHNATIAEILQASGILPANLSLPPGPVKVVSSPTQHVTLPANVNDIGSAVIETPSADWVQVDNSSTKHQQVTSTADSSVVTLAGPLEFLNEAESAVLVKDSVEAIVEQTELEEEQTTEQQVFSITTDLSENDFSFIPADKQFESQPVTSQIIIEAVPTKVPNDHSQITFLPSLNAPVSIQHSDLDASNMPLEEYTSQQIENQGLT